MIAMLSKRLLQITIFAVFCGNFPRKCFVAIFAAEPIRLVNMDVNPNRSHGREKLVYKENEILQIGKNW